MAQGALSAFKVLDLTHYIAGPYCTRLLAGAGAEVIKVEKPGEGDGARRLGPFLQDEPHPEKSGLFLYLNANKKSVTLNLKTESGVQLFKRLVAKADVLVENFEPRVMPSLGLDYETLAKINPSLVMTSISNFGQTGPYRDYKATEIVEYAVSGLMYITGDPDREPLKVGGALSQYIAGQTAYVATLGVLFYRERTGEGQYVDVSIMEHGASDMELQMMQYQFQNYVVGRTGYANPKGHPWGVMPCRDGWVALAVTDDYWPRLVELLNVPELLDARFASRDGRLQNRDEVDAYLLPWLVERDRKEIFQILQDVRITAGYVRNMEEVVDCPQLQARGYFFEVDHPVAGKLTYPGAPFQMSASPWQKGRAPLLGEHTAEVLASLAGCSQGDVVKLCQAGVV